LGKILRRANYDKNYALEERKLLKEEFYEAGNNNACMYAARNLIDLANKKAGVNGDNISALVVMFQ